jgi:hypothetical protein
VSHRGALVARAYALVLFDRYRLRSQLSEMHGNTLGTLSEIKGGLEMLLTPGSDAEVGEKAIDCGTWHETSMSPRKYERMLRAAKKEFV